MRNTIFISLSLALATSAMAQDGPTPGCYMRDYSQAHLDAHPNQVVRSVGMWIHDSAEYSERYAYLVVDFANQGHVRRDGLGAQRLDQSLVCYRMQDGRQGCAVDCDGGSFTVSKETDTTLTISTSYLMVGEVDGCGGAIDMAERVGKDVKYRLNKVADSQCLALIEN